MKLINYRCNCGNEVEEFYFSGEEIPETIKCSKCSKRMKQYNYKNNKQRVFICDPQH